MKKYKEELTKNGLQMPSIKPRESIVALHTGSSRFHAQLRMTAEMSVLKELGITKKILHDMGVAQLKLLLSLLHTATSEVTTRLGKKTG